jgi:hypothetical protein
MTVKYFHLVHYECCPLWGDRRRALVVLIFGTRQRWVISIASRPLYSSEKSRLCPFYMNLGGHKIRLWRLRWRREKSLILSGIEPWYSNLQPVDYSQQVTDWTIRRSQIICTWYKIYSSLIQWILNVPRLVIPRWWSCPPIRLHTVNINFTYNAGTETVSRHPRYVEGPVRI